MSSVAHGLQSRSHLLAAELMSVIISAEELAERLEDAAYEEAEPGLAYAARVVRKRLTESRGLLEAVLGAPSPHG